MAVLAPRAGSSETRETNGELLRHNYGMSDFG